MMVWRPGLVLVGLLFLVAPRELSYTRPMELKHTPGPWFPYDRGIGWEVHCGEANAVGITACVNDGFRDTFNEADARLIATAPELLAGLKRAVAGLDNLVEVGALISSFRVECRSVARELAAIIAKAETSTSGTDEKAADTEPQGGVAKQS